MADWIEVAPGIALTREGAAWLPGAATLIIADVDVAPRALASAADTTHGEPPAPDAGAVAERILAIASRLGARRLVVAGALRRSAREMDDDRLDAMNVLRSRLTALERVEFLAGARGTPERPHEAAIALRVGDVEVRDAPPVGVPDRWVVCGSLRPVLRGAAGERARRCALVGPRVLVLPAFGGAAGQDAERLLAALPPAGWRVVPVTDVAPESD